MRYCRFTEKLGFPSETLENHLLSCHVHRLTRFRHHITSFWLTWPLFPPPPPPRCRPPVPAPTMTLTSLFSQKKRSQRRQRTRPSPQLTTVRLQLRLGKGDFHGLFSNSMALQARHGHATLHLVFELRKAQARP